MSARATVFRFVWYAALSFFSPFNCVFFFSISGPDIWLEYAQYSIGGMGLSGGIDKVRSIFERAMTAVGLHVTKGQMVWEAYREFENAIFSTLQVCLHISILCFNCWFMPVVVNVLCERQFLKQGKIDKLDCNLNKVTD